MIRLKQLLDEIYVSGFTSSEKTKSFRVPENFDLYEQGCGWAAYRGANDWETGTTGVCAYLGPEGYHREQARIWFEVQYPKDLSEMVGSGLQRTHPKYNEIKEWGDKAAQTWMREVRRIHRVSNPVKRIQDVNHPNFKRKSWKECFIESLASEAMKPFVKNYGVDHTNWKGMSKETINECFKQGDGWFVHEGNQSISVIFENGKKLSFEVSSKGRGIDDKDAWRHKAASKWISTARGIHKNTDLNEIGNPIQKTWEQCFIEALNDDSLKPFFKESNGVFQEADFSRNA